ncbi:hypothetical protein BO71DRAFT_126465 [Aspergillus ellipticus CBS 707.79]|uniref:Uncharacterized protein n=1 Tax=Aspergillus ellipticus CBS 707.79 TaxID=1448320 RepID=A0A319DTT8_9EURO|nr:hypothetical protein BO71DRAFT_126465 [Aspergillus ellipticus CBS 707.79]
MFPCSNFAVYKTTEGRRRTGIAVLVGRHRQSAVVCRCRPIRDLGNPHSDDVPTVDMLNQLTIALTDIDMSFGGCKIGLDFQVLLLPAWRQCRPLAHIGPDKEAAAQLGKGELEGFSSRSDAIGYGNLGESSRLMMKQLAMSDEQWTETEKGRKKNHERFGWPVVGALVPGSLSA